VLASAAVRRLTVLLALLALALAVVAAGCGGSNSESSATTTDTSALTETTTEETTTEETTSSDTTDSTDLSGVLGNEDCLALAGVGASIAQAFSGAVDNGDQASLDELASKVPDEIKADVTTLAQALATYSAKIKGIGIEPGSTPSAAQLQQLQTAIASLDQTELTAASQRLEAWSKENCTG
jgi:ABC-type glycerol-3-phosphate transport system substrate-binding protein